MSYEIDNLLRNLKNQERAGQAREAFVRSTRARILAFADEGMAKPSWMQTLLGRAFGETTELLARPLAFASLLVAVIFGGWLTSVNASLNTLPGDTLYSVKIASENARISLAPSRSRSQLRAEYASRRLKEVETLVESDRTDKTERIKTAVRSFEKHIGAVRTEISASKEEAVVVELARLVDKTADELETVLERTEDSEGADVESVAVIEGAVTGTDTVREQVVTALVAQVNEETPTQPSQLELRRQFRDGLREVAAQSGALEARIDVIERVLEKTEREDVTFDVAAHRNSLVLIDLSQAANTAAAGGYEAAFEDLNAVRQLLRDISSKLIAAEIALSRPMQVTEEPVVEEKTDTTVEEAEAIQTRVKEQESTFIEAERKSAEESTEKVDD